MVLCVTTILRHFVRMAWDYSLHTFFNILVILINVEINKIFLNSSVFSS